MLIAGPRYVHGILAAYVEHHITDRSHQRSGLTPRAPNNALG
jgi:hypothetical protein